MCGILGMIGKEPMIASMQSGLLHLQHRGQDAVGIFVFDSQKEASALNKQLGTLKQEMSFSLADADWGLGHLRYSTIGKGRLQDAQPIYNEGVAVAYNGNIVNYLPLKRSLEREKVAIKTCCDAEIILHLFKRALRSHRPLFADIVFAATEVQKQVLGSYSILFLIEKVGMVAIRDSSGIRPFLFGVRGKDYAFSSENYPIKVLGFQTITDIAPGEIVFVDHKLNLHRQMGIQKKRAHCSFEYNYFSRPHSVLDGREVYSVRVELGKQLGIKIKRENLFIDAVIPIPATASPAAIAVAKVLGTSYEEGFVKQGYVGRTFIMAKQSTRKKAVAQKLVPIGSVFNGRNVLLVDDSIVRGTVSERVVCLAREAGACKVYFASTFPPIRHPCFYGIDFPCEKSLIAAGKAVDEIAAEIKADALFYNGVAEVQAALGMRDLCTACFTGKYPTLLDGHDELKKLRRKDLT
ncbi:MAG: amidophosphoribosyltransferase [Chlamydiota bacterium]